jgi:heme exporter protein D
MDQFAGICFLIVVAMMLIGIIILMIEPWRMQRQIAREYQRRYRENKREKEDETDDAQ